MASTALISECSVEDGDLKGDIASFDSAPDGSKKKRSRNRKKKTVCDEVQSSGVVENVDEKDFDKILDYKKVKLNTIY